MKADGTWPDMAKSVGDGEGEGERGKERDGGNRRAKDWHRGVDEGL